jgi:hypothetical protein
MSTNICPERLNQITSCLVGSNIYQITASAGEFQNSPLEEMTDTIRQADGRCYLRAQSLGQKGELWMIPFTVSEQRRMRLLETVEYITENCLGRPNLFFPFDVVGDDYLNAYLIRPIEKTASAPVRTFLPEASAERWKIAISLFSRVKEMAEMGITSNGISREQIRVIPDSWEAAVWFNETVSLAAGSEQPYQTSRHEGFLSIPVLTEKKCAELDEIINGRMRDVYSAAIVAFYLIMYTHPFIGSSYYSLLRDDYLARYLYYPEYIMDPGSENTPGNQVLSAVVNHQWTKTVPELRKMFDSIFMAVCDPAHRWDPRASYWDPELWIRALRLDAEANDNPSSRTDFNFADERYHQV